MFEFRTNYEFSDVVALNKRSTRYKSLLFLFTKLAVWICLVLIFLLALAFVRISVPPQSLLYYQVVSMSVIGVAWLAVWWLVRSVNLYSMLDALRSMGPTAMRVDDQGITSDAGGIVASIPWGRVIRLVETPTHILPYYAPRLAMILRKADLSPEEAKRLAAFVREHVPSPALAAG